MKRPDVEPRTPKTTRRPPGGQRAGPPPTETKEPEVGWGRPAASRKWHYFRGGMSFCRKWGFFAGEIQDAPHGPKGPEDCVVCHRIRAKQAS